MLGARCGASSSPIALAAGQRHRRIMLVLLAGPIVGLERNQTRRREAET